MSIAPPSADLLDQPALELMDLFGRMRSLADRHGFSGTLPAVWQCSDETQMIKKALFGYFFDCPVFNLGRVGALLDPSKVRPASEHGRDLVILGGSHLGAHEHNGIGVVQRVHGKMAHCCGKLLQVLDGYLRAYRRAEDLITLERRAGELVLDIPYKYLLPKAAGTTARIMLHLPALVSGEPLGESGHGHFFRLNPAFAARHAESLAGWPDTRTAIGNLLDAQTFSFRKLLDTGSRDPLTMLELSLFPHLPDAVSSPYPHRRIADLNTWCQFHQLAAYLTDLFNGSDRNIFVVAGLTLDQTIKHNTFIPQFGFKLLRGRALDTRYYGPREIAALLAEQSVYIPPQSFLEYAGIAPSTTNS
ncbi:hypothetical protein SAMN05660860_01407 [Geoalkalibacter ferrihydriticus]|uniref:Limiting CO2-inducible protein B/C beta carbonyic anhydrase domain-containing protein n=2 Tax=Geoalkalibacter ferrihydriticus TaxID=392333 RepID=A0A0C2HSU5_9BACT|nr:hypothetical protein [Geoalkalibacter ferrihydriticus]KIH77875.1 hypothetical protein GFER_04445 [Geoalkalibacter ferrihydriticus DSM 17813]SDL83849.1 hypothetical protein SAMN05660860_01407 [Geoalkalibacter ferrihydriticus]